MPDPLNQGASATSWLTLQARMLSSHATDVRASVLTLERIRLPDTVRECHASDRSICQTHVGWVKHHADELSAASHPVQDQLISAPDREARVRRSNSDGNAIWR